MPVGEEVYGDTEPHRTPEEVKVKRVAEKKGANAPVFILSSFSA